MNALQNGIGALITLGVALSVGVPTAGYAQTAGVTAPEKDVIWSISDLKWKPNPVYKNAYVAVLWGNPDTGAYGMLRTFPAGTVIPMHAHANTVKLILMSGTMTLGLNEGSTKWYGPGMYTSLPGGLRHTQTCITECTYFESAEKAFMTSIQCDGKEGSQQRVDAPCAPLGPKP
jgi:quercetin dioxygenase-like cupin family protein